MTCGKCKWFDRTFDGLLLIEHFDDEEDLGGCEWPADRLPYSLRYGNRERLGVYAYEGKGCAGFEPIDAPST